MIQRILPMNTQGTEHLIERIYRESGAYQWARETLVNALEANATRIEFGIEWQAVERRGVYRRLIADNGDGMSADDLVGFFNTFGGGGKPIGGVHENFGVGSKTSLLPWNQAGLVVISLKNGETSMIWVQKDPTTTEYGLRLVKTFEPSTGIESHDEVYEPYYDTELEVDWSACVPAWVEASGHGTVLILLGNRLDQDTVLGDPNQEESDIKGLSKYVNQRLWEVPNGVEIYVDELRTNDPVKWPKSRAEAHGPQAKDGPDTRTNRRQIRGVLNHIDYQRPSFDTGRLGAHGTVTLSDATDVHWYLWEGERPHIHSYTEKNGFIAARYRNELYDVTKHHATYRSFGVSESKVRTNLWLIIEPKPFDEASKWGVYPRTDRNALLLKGGPTAGQPLPMLDWAAEFAENMPEPIIQAIRAARSKGGGSVDDASWRERLAARFGSRWKISKLRAHPDGTELVTPSVPSGIQGPRPAKRRTRAPRSGTRGGRTGDATLGDTPGATRADIVKVDGGIPSYRFVSGDDLPEGMLAAWQPHDLEHPEGVVLINIDHPVLTSEVQHWQEQYPSYVEEQVADEIRNIYGQIAVAKVAHSEHLKSYLPATTVENELRSEVALTMALLGLMGEECLIASRLAGSIPAKRRLAA